MAGRIDFEPASTPLCRPKPLVIVFRRNTPGQYDLLPNVVAEEIQERFGADPGICRFRYTADGYAQSGYPIRIEEILPLGASGPYVVRNDDELVVVAFDPWGERRYLFHGFAKIPQVDLSAAQEQVTFQAIGVAEREWDTPLSGSWWRDADQATVAQGADALVGIPARINPDGLPSATDAGADRTSGGFQFPTFLDPLVCQNRGIGRKWSLAMAARYILGVGNPDQTYVKLPSWQAIDQLLDCWTPTDGRSLDPTDPSSYQTEPIVLREQVISGRTWPEALDGLLRPNGFGMRFQLESDADGEPVTRLIIWRRDSGDSSRYKELFLPKPGNTLDVSCTNVGAVQVARDGSQIANRVVVETDLLHHEASFVLAPGFAIDVNDVSNRANFKRTSPLYPQNRDSYRTFVFDETGDGHWDLGSSTWKTGTGTDLVKVLGLANQDQSLYIKRRRPGQQTLISRDAAGQPQRATLHISFNYTGFAPGVWDGSGTWRTVKGEWSLLRDRLGIHLDCEDPNAFNVGSLGSETGRAASQSIRAVEWLAGSPALPFYLRLTTAIEGDQRALATVEKRPASPTRFTITHQVDAKDRYAVELVSKWSEFSPQPGWQGHTADTFGRVDTDDALADARARQAALELPHLAGIITIPRLTLSYQVGDRLLRIRGRDVELQTNSGTGDGESPVYAEVIGRTFVLGRQLATKLLVSDRRADDRT